MHVLTELPLPVDIANRLGVSCLVNTLIDPVFAVQAATKLMCFFMTRKNRKTPKGVGSRMGRRQASSDIAQRVATQKGVRTKRSEDELRLLRKTPRGGGLGLGMD